MEEKFGVKTKSKMLEELKGKLAERPDIILTNYKGLNTQALETLRKKLGTANSAYFVVKNSLLKRALGEKDLKGIEPYIKGEVGLGLVGDMIGASKAMVDFAKENNALKVSCAFFDGKLTTPERIKELAMLPPREILLATIFSRMKSPITGFVGVLSGLLRNLVYAINEIKNKKEGGDKK